MSQKRLKAGWKPLKGMNRVAWGSHRNDVVGSGVEGKKDVLEK